MSARSLIAAMCLLWVQIGASQSRQDGKAQPTTAQQGILVLTNQDRAAQGLQPLHWSPELAAAAQQHAKAMADAGTLSHQLAGEPNVADRAAHAGAHFQSVAENIAYGPSAQTIEHEWMHSVPHRANILDPRMNSIGVGIVSSRGTLWAVEDFADSIAELTPDAIEAEVGNELKAHGVAIAAPDTPETQAARAACPQFEGGAGAHARFVVRWESANITQLPGPLAAALTSGRYARAAVASCPATNQRNADFTVYRVAVLLF